MKKPYQTFRDAKLERLIGPDPEAVRERRSEAAKRGWADKKERGRERRFEELEARVEMFDHLGKGGKIQ